MDESLQKIVQSMQQGEGMIALSDDEFKHSDRIKFAITILLDYPHKTRVEQVKMLMEEFQLTNRADAYRYINEGIEIYPSIEKVNKAFERARIANLCYKLIAKCTERGDKINTRDPAQYLKILTTIFGLEFQDDSENAVTQEVINILKDSPESLGVPLPKNFNLQKFKVSLEAEYERRSNTIDIAHQEIKPA